MIISTEKSNEITLEELQDIINKHFAEYGLVIHQVHYTNGVSTKKHIHRNSILEVFSKRKYKEVASFGFPEKGKIFFISKSKKLSIIIKKLEPKIPYSTTIWETLQ